MFINVLVFIKTLVMNDGSTWIFEQCVNWIYTVSRLWESKCVSFQ